MPIVPHRGPHPFAKASIFVGLRRPVPKETPPDSSPSQSTETRPSGDEVPSTKPSK